MDMTRPCPYCAEIIQAGAIKCKFCGETIPNAGGQAAPISPVASGSRTCPGCGAQVQGQAARCPFCGDDFGGGTASAPPPSYTAQPYAARYAGQPVDTNVPRPKGDNVLILGLVALVGGFLCGPLLLVGPFAWMSGRKYEDQCRALGVEPDSNGKTGKILGIIASILVILGVVVVGGILLLGVVAAGASSVK